MLHGVYRELLFRFGPLTEFQVLKYPARAPSEGYPVPPPLLAIIDIMDLRPLHDRVLVRRLEAGEEKRGGIIIPDTAKEKPQQAEVISVGSGKLLDSGERATPEVRAGDRILFGKYSGAETKIDGQEYLILREDEILGVLE
jgi:chaperonin GroES